MYAANTALAGLYETYARELHGFARRRVGRQEAEDIVQDTYLHLLQRGTAGTLVRPRPLPLSDRCQLGRGLCTQDQGPVALLERGNPRTCNAEGPPCPEARRRKRARIAAAACHPCGIAASLPGGLFAQSSRGSKPC